MAGPNPPPSFYNGTAIKKKYFFCGFPYPSEYQIDRGSPRSTRILKLHTTKAAVEKKPLPKIGNVGWNKKNLAKQYGSFFFAKSDFFENK